MKYYLKLLRYYLNFLSFFNPKYGGKVAVKAFQKIHLKKIKSKELPFYESAISKRLSLKNNTSIMYYQKVNPKGKLVFLVHGWNSNAGSLSKFAEELAAKDYNVISLDLPAHAKSEGTHTNLFICKNALIELINHINPQEPFSIVGHSFGAAVAVYAVAELNLPINKIVLLSANNKMKIIFKDYQKLVGFNNVIFNEVAKWVKTVLKIDLDNLILSDKIKLINYNELMMIHDKYDKVLPYQSALEIKDAIANTKLIPFEKIGHYRMLWNDDVIKETINFIEN